MPLTNVESFVSIMNEESWVAVETCQPHSALADRVIVPCFVIWPPRSSNSATHPLHPFMLICSTAALDLLCHHCNEHSSSYSAFKTCRLTILPHQHVTRTNPLPLPALEFDTNLWLRHMTHCVHPFPVVPRLSHTPVNAFLQSFDVEDLHVAK